MAIADLFAVVLFVHIDIARSACFSNYGDFESCCDIRAYSLGESPRGCWNTTGAPSFSTFERCCHGTAPAVRPSISLSIGDEDSCQGQGCCGKGTIWDGKRCSIAVGAPRGGRRVILELGAADGDWTRRTMEYMLQRPGPDIWCHAFEANPDMCSMLKENLLNIGCTLDCQAVWDMDETKLFSSYPEKEHFSSFEENMMESEEISAQRLRLPKQRWVQAMDVGNWMLENVSPSDFIFLKIDIEGAEYRVLRRLLTLGVLCWMTEIHLEFHALNNAKNERYRPVDVVVPWILRGCPGKTPRVFTNLYYNEPLVRSRYAKKIDAEGSAGFEFAKHCDLCPALNTPIIEDDLAWDHALELKFPPVSEKKELDDMVPAWAERLIAKVEALSKSVESLQLSAS